MIKKTEIMKKNDIINITMILSLFAFGVFMGFYIKKEKLKLVPVYTVSECEKVEDTFNLEKLESMIAFLEIKYPKVVMAQAILESGHFKSDLFLNSNNIFGMKKARTRATTSDIGVNSFAKYDNWRESVIDYALFQAYYISRVNSESEYLALLGRIYAEDKRYVEKLKRLML